MGACLCKGHKDLHLHMTSLQDQTEEGQTSTVKEDQNPSNGNVPDKSGHYDIGELATSTLMGLVATIKEHITKPTAMAQGRVAHLIEWKGWGGGGEAGGGGGGWSYGRGGGGGWGGMGAELQEDEQLYSQMTDEIKEARFAAGVAQQFALAEAAMNMWSMNDSAEQPSTSIYGQKTPAASAAAAAAAAAAQSQFLSQFLLDGGSIGIPQHLYNVHTQNYGSTRSTNLVPVSLVDSIPPTLLAQLDREHSFEDRSAVAAGGAVRHVDSSSLSEDDVFYN